MYKNQIIVLVKKDGQPLRETEGKFVYLPFNSEYSLEIKNQSWRRAIASIKIDGTDVLGGDELIIPAYGSSDIERFLTNGDLHKGRKLKFVPLSDSKVQDPSSPENGLVEIEVWFEKQEEIKIITTTTYQPWWGSGSNWCTYDDGHETLSSDHSFKGTKMYRSASPKGFSKNLSDGAMGHTINCCSSFSAPMQFAAQNMSNAGATVEGGHSNQSFSRVSFGQKDYPSITFKFWLRGVGEEVTTSDKLYCSNCGKKTRFDYKYCPRCGSPIQIA